MKSPFFCFFLISSFFLIFSHSHNYSHVLGTALNHLITENNQTEKMSNLKKQFLDIHKNRIKDYFKDNGLYLADSTISTKCNHKNRQN